MIIKQSLIDVNGFSRPGHKLMYVKKIVNHWVGKSRQTSGLVQAYFSSLKNQDPYDAMPDVYGSTHFAIDADTILRLVPEDEIAYHVGAWSYTQDAIETFGDYATSNAVSPGSTPNWYCLGIEWNHIDDEGRYSKETYENGVKLNAYLCREYKLDPTKDILRHYDITGKLCPKWFVLHQLDWEIFIGAVEEEMNEL